MSHIILYVIVTIIQNIAQDWTNSNDSLLIIYIVFNFQKCPELLFIDVIWVRSIIVQQKIFKDFQIKAYSY